MPRGEGKGSLCKRAQTRFKTELPDLLNAMAVYPRHTLYRVLNMVSLTPFAADASWVRASRDQGSPRSQRTDTSGSSASSPLGYVLDSL
jgi:hypothetical protein